MNNKDYLEYSTEAMASLPMLFSTVEKIVLFFEDHDKHNFYEMLLERIFTPTICEHLHVETCKGKVSVLSTYEAYKEVPSDDACLFILDSDFDFINDTYQQDESGLIVYFDRYNIENFLVDENSLFGFIRIRVNKRHEELINLLNFTEWYSSVISNLYNLFVLYIVIQRHTNPTLPNVENGSGCERYIHSNGYIDTNQIDILKNNLCDKVPNLDEKIAEVKKDIQKAYGQEKRSCICGKYLIHVAYRYCLKKAPGKIRLEDFTGILLDNFNIDSLANFKAKVMSLFCDKEYDSTKSA